MAEDSKNSGGGEKFNLAKRIQQFRAEEDLRRERKALERKQYYDDHKQSLLTEGEKRNGLLDVGGTQVQTVTKTGKYKIDLVIAKYLTEKREQSNWKIGTVTTAQSIFDLFMEVMGARHFDTLGYEEIRYYKEIVLKLPKNRNCINKFRGKHITEIIELDGFETVSTKTKNKYLQYVSALFDWAKRHGYTDNNYAEGFTLRVTDEDERQRFTKWHLEKIFYSDEYMQCNGKKHKNAFRF